MHFFSRIFFCFCFLSLFICFLLSLTYLLFFYVFLLSPFVSVRFQPSFAFTFFLSIHFFLFFFNLSLLVLFFFFSSISFSLFFFFFPYLCQNILFLFTNKTKPETQNARFSQRLFYHRPISPLLNVMCDNLRSNISLSWVVKLVTRSALDSWTFYSWRNGIKGDNVRR